MATAREIVKRRKSVVNIRKITKTMEMIATSKFRKARDRAVNTRPYTERITELVATLAADESLAREHPILLKNDQSRRTILLVLTGNRGLCGGYNGAVLRRAVEKMKELDAAGQDIELRVSGKKGIQYFKHANQPVEVGYVKFDDNMNYREVERLADEFIDQYYLRIIDSVQVVYAHFVSTARYYADVFELLPLSSREKMERFGRAKIDMENYTFSPTAHEILRELIPNAVRMGLFQCFMDAIVSEQSARMSAMKAATDNAEQMIRSLTQQYNRVRQSQITGELLDIIGGVEALK